MCPQHSLYNVFLPLLESSVSLDRPVTPQLTTPPASKRSSCVASSLTCVTHMPRPPRTRVYLGHSLPSMPNCTKLHETTVRSQPTNRSQNFQATTFKWKNCHSTIPWMRHSDFPIVATRKYWTGTWVSSIDSAPCKALIYVQ